MFARLHTFGKALASNGGKLEEAKQNREIFINTFGISGCTWIKNTSRVFN
jgi:hypothetical protein